ncbi:MAG: hypothetical protein H6865_08255 [Rhodospirillales bacterium]|nr:hypothetical protein [Alphaproteobacteria bacterium]MCB9987608.1 hypothetical protein [Rhodospirillales bacterium]USO07677.1 MAG: hypothetical protein H6866_00095 [Rhodospirillales bacterium]
MGLFQVFTTASGTLESAPPQERSDRVRRALDAKRLESGFDLLLAAINHGASFLDSNMLIVGSANPKSAVYLGYVTKLIGEAVEELGPEAKRDFGPPVRLFLNGLHDQWRALQSPAENCADANANGFYYDITAEDRLEAARKLSIYARALRAGFNRRYQGPVAADINAGLR